MHKDVQDFIQHGGYHDDGSEPNVNYARWVLDYFTMSAICKMDFEPFMKDNKLFCQFEGKTYRVTGASTLGDVWLTANYEQDTGYQKRVSVNDCSNWNSEPFNPSATKGA